MNETVWPQESALTRREMALGLAYLPFHTVAMPQLLNALAAVHPWMTTAVANGILYGVGTVFVALAFGRRLFAHYCLWMDRFSRVLLTMCRGYLLYMGLSLILGAVLPLLQPETAVNPNNEALSALRGADFRVTFALAIFIAPILEEILFRGVVFGWVREKFPRGSYAITWALFAAAHLWQFAVPGVPLGALALQYIPLSFALCYCYDKSGCLWAPICLHMINNMMAYNMIA